MVTSSQILSTLHMIDREKLDVRTITMGISLFGCVSDDEDRLCQKVYDHIARTAQNLVRVGEEIEREIGVPIVNKRISVTPAALISGGVTHPVKLAKALDRAARATGVNFIGGYSALVQKGMTAADRRLMDSIPEALSETEFLCSSINIGSTRAGIDMDAVRLMGQIVKDTAQRTAEAGGLGCAKLVVFCNAVEDNPFMAGAFHGPGEGDCAVSVGVSGPGVVKCALEAVRGQPFDEVAETIKRTAFRITRVGQLVAREASRRLNVPFGIVDLSLAPTPSVGDSVAAILEELHMIEIDKTRLHARIPVIRFEDPVSHIQCDLCFNNALPIRNTLLLKTYAYIDVRVRALGMIIKKWSGSFGGIMNRAKINHLNNPIMKTLNSYGFILMLIHFLQSAMSPPLLPILQARPLRLLHV